MVVEAIHQLTQCSNSRLWISTILQYKQELANAYTRVELVTIFQELERSDI